MYFIISKLFSFLLKPFLWIFVLLLVSFFSSKKSFKRKTLLIATLAIFIFGNHYIFNFFASQWEQGLNLKSGELNKYSTLVVLGGYNQWNMETQMQDFNASADRLTVVLPFLYDSSKTILISGGSGILGYNGVKEADMTLKFLKEFKNIKAKILIENKSKNTIENISNSNEIIKKENLKNVLVISSTFHVRRILKILKNQNLDWTCRGVETLKDYNKPIESIIVPDAYVIQKWNSLLHEYVGYFFSKN